MDIVHYRGHGYSEQVKYVTAMRVALAEASASPDPSTQNGGVALDSDGRIVGRGSNTFTMGTRHDLTTMKREHKYMYVEHAERMTLFDAARTGHHVDALVVPWAACAECARAIVELDVNTLVRLPGSGFQGSGSLAALDRWQASIVVGEEILSNGGIRVVEIPLSAVGDFKPLLRGGKLWPE